MTKAPMGMTSALFLIFAAKAYWVLQVGGEAYADYHLKPWFLLRGAGFAHFGFRFNWTPAQRLAFRIGIAYPHPAQDPHAPGWEKAYVLT